jgi:hypothetical protein
MAAAPQKTSEKTSGENIGGQTHPGPQGR